MAKSDAPDSRTSAAMIGVSANKRAPSARGIFSPLRHAVFRRIWTASLLSNLGILVLGVGAAWTMTQISSSTGMVALVHAMATIAPPHKPIVIDWPDAIRVDGGFVGGASLVAPEGADAAAPPPWGTQGPKSRELRPRVAERSPVDGPGLRSAHRGIQDRCAPRPRIPPEVGAASWKFLGSEALAPCLAWPLGLLARSTRSGLGVHSRSPSRT